MGPQVVPHQVRVDLGVITMSDESTLSKASELEPHEITLKLSGNVNKVY